MLGAFYDTDAAMWPRERSLCMARWWWLGGLVCVLMMSAISWATRGTVRTAQGQSFTGNVVRNDDGSVSVTSDQGIETRIDAGDVAVVMPVASVDEEFHNRLSRLDAGEVRGRMDLADWASQNGRPDLAEAALRQVLEIQPQNHEAARELQGAQRQIELDQAAPHRAATTRPLAIPATAPGAASPATAPATQAVEVPTSAPAQLLTDDQVNTLRQKELPADDTTVRIVFRGDVVRRYLASGHHDAAQFHELSMAQQAKQILATDDPDLLSDVRVLGDPPSLRIYRQRINTIVCSACGAIGCHGGQGSGDFHLYSNMSPNAAYTNFYILQSYSTSVNGEPYLAVDRTLPERSLLLQYGLAADEATVAHPKVTGYRPRYRVRSDGGYQQVLGWINDDLAAVAPNYGLPVSATYDPAGTPTTRPSMRTATSSPALR